MVEDPESWEITQNSANVALAHAWQWGVAVRTQAARVSQGSGGLQQIPDAYLLVVALRNVRRAADMAMASLATDQAKEQLQEALHDFESAMPGAKEARDVLEHFDEYTRGVGQQQRRVQGAATQTAEQLARMFSIGFDYGEPPDPSHPRLHVGPHTIDIAQAGDAAGLLTLEIWAAVKTDQGEPTSRAAAAALYRYQEDDRGRQPEIRRQRTQMMQSLAGEDEAAR